jgi:hypothetical protein
MSLVARQLCERDCVFRHIRLRGAHSAMGFRDDLVRFYRRRFLRTLPTNVV